MKTRHRKLNRRKSRKIKGGRQFMSNVGYSSGYSMPVYKPFITNVV
jgi:hypothetical protein